MKYFLVGLMLFCSCAAEAKVDYRRYHLDIIRCEERFLFRDDTAGALQLYGEVFGKYRPFAKDCFIALQLAAVKGDTNAALSFFRSAFEAGLSWDAVTHSKVIASLLNSDSEFMAQVSRLYSESKRTFDAGINAQYRQEIIRMKTVDDSMKMRIQGFPPGDPIGKKRFEEYQQLLESNVRQLQSIVKKYGFPSERAVGFMDYPLDGGDEQRIEYCYSLRLLADQLFFHQGCSFFLLEKEMEDALIAGDLMPGAYAVIYEWAYESFKKGKLAETLCRPAHPQEAYYNICPVIVPWERYKDVERVNKCREQIGLPSLEHESRKKEVEKKTGLKLFFGMFNLY